ncbi:MAG: ribonuclease HII [Candidatus Chisholmbacteria bacterium RIFCSPHIGHO2_01_FULL_49_18]|uniref:Ribonuclease HII n=2 Tax=Candidatus Chisholmiibacteriota TaxID=1817900 RepID=A0A1G1VN86_9BACT|nr:MAG: ribonuclease HII [Candidatus Chisholmbacteria bacterium RIFCSPHIGHO2_01_FULL_49_18]OGY21344.1 MAG: ribonuclease HII [Candidatus Chisholmbacteria bacterium RIFCSPLOWO2_01_FULL_49_14]
MRPTLRYEKRLWEKGYTRIAGVDEVGRGAFAGPIVSAAVVFPKMHRKIHSLHDVRDSKLLSAKKRELLAPKLRKMSLQWSVGSASTSEINNYGIVKATFTAMRRALKKLKHVEYVLIDAFYIPYLRGLSRKRQLAIVKGDARCFSIAAASILAKVHRDRLMVELGNQFPQYHLDRHKGYGTLLHRQALKKFGAQSFHRKIFISKYI